MLEGKQETPILDELTRHAAKEKVSLHVPGHHQGRLVPEPLSGWLGQATKLDATELGELDNLHQAQGCIQTSQALAARHYGSSHCFYSVNGATAGVMAAMAACVETTGNRRVIILGPCHMSAWRGLVYADAEPVFVRTEWLSDVQAFNVPTARQLETALAETRQGIAAIFVTSPTYQGRVAPIRALADVAHRFGVPLVVDEAHGAHFGLHPLFPEHSVERGADIVIQSPHKTLPCLTQAAWVHLQGDRVAPEVLSRWLLFLHTTSPSYLLLAALDSAQAWLRLEGRQAAEETVRRLSQFRDVADAARGGWDPMRLWVPTGSEEESRRLEAMLEEAGVYIEYADAMGALAIFGFLQPLREYEKFFCALEQWRVDSVGSIQLQDEEMDGLYALDPHLVMSPRSVMYGMKRRVPLHLAAGEVLAVPVSPYPPGVPALWPGQRLEGEHVRRLEHWRSTGKRIVGVDESGRIEVMDVG